MSMKLTPELDGAAQHRLGLVAVGRLAPDARAGDAHGAEAEPVDREVAADVDGPGCGRRQARVVCHLCLLRITFSFASDRRTRITRSRCYTLRRLDVGRIMERRQPETTTIGRSAV